MNLKNNDEKCFQYAITVVLNHEEIINMIGKRQISHHIKDWKEFEANNESNFVNVLYLTYNTEEIRHAYKSEHNKERENQVILLIITDGKKN